MIKSLLYYLPLVAAYLIYSAKNKGFHTELSQGKLILAVVFIVVPAIYWVVDRIRGDRR